MSSPVFATTVTSTPGPSVPRAEWVFGEMRKQAPHKSRAANPSGQHRDPLHAAPSFLFRAILCCFGGTGSPGATVARSSDEYLLIYFIIMVLPSENGRSRWRERAVERAWIMDLSCKSLGSWLRRHRWALARPGAGDRGLRGRLRIRAGPGEVGRVEDAVASAEIGRGAGPDQAEPPGLLIQVPAVAAAANPHGVFAQAPGLANRMFRRVPATRPADAGRCPTSAPGLRGCI